VIVEIGAYGVAIIILTIIVRLVLAPLQQFQLVRQRRTMAEQRKLAPEVAELRKKYKKDTQRLNQEMMKLYQEHGINPLGGFVGCLPLVVQIPILTALYWVFTGFSKAQHAAAHFLFVPNLNENPLHQIAFHLFGLPVPSAAYLVFPLLAALTTLATSKMLQMPPPPNPTEQEAQTAQMQRTMIWLSPVMIGFFALNVPAGLGLYWFVGNCVSIIQQSFVVGWGNLLPARFGTVAGGAPSLPPKGAGGSSGPPKNGPPPRRPKNKPRDKPPKR
jgi:YidC/Oxa1 family membrane protein insertase